MLLALQQCPSCNAETVHHTALTKSKANSLTAAAVKGSGRVGEHPRDRNESRSCNAMLAGDGVVQVIASICVKITTICLKQNASDTLNNNKN